MNQVPERVAPEKYEEIKTKFARLSNSSVKGHMPDIDESEFIEEVLGLYDGAERKIYGVLNLIRNSPNPEVYNPISFALARKVNEIVNNTAFNLADLEIIEGFIAKTFPENDRSTALKPGIASIESTVKNKIGNLKGQVLAA